MKYCKKCGKQLNDDLRFCTGCGTPCDADTTAQTPGAPAQKSVSVNIDMAKFSKILPTSNDAVLSENPFINLIKKSGSGISFFVYLVLYGLSLLVGLIGAFSAKLPGMDLIDELGSGLGFSSSDLMDVVPFLDTLNDGFIMFKFIGLIPAILIFIGSLIFYMRCKSGDGLKTPADGLKFIKIPVMFYLVVNSILTAICLLAGLLGAIGSEEFVVLIIGIFASLIFVASVVYYGMINRVMKGVKNSLASGSRQYPDKMLRVLVVFNFISAFITLIFGGNGVFGNIVDAGALTAITVCVMTFASSSKALEMQLASAAATQN